MVSFATASNYSLTPTCEVGVNEGSYSHNFTGLTHTYTAGNWDGLLHTVVLDTQSVSSTAKYFHYSCDAGETVSYFI